MKRTLKIGIVAGEISGDLLGADLIHHLRQQMPRAVFAGLGGDKMIDRGFQSLFSMERLSVMGFVDPLKRLPELLRIRQTLYHYFLDEKFDLVIGIDSPDFNLGLERKLRRRGVLTAHYVSPSVWAWRQGRVKKIARAVDRMFTLLPFEADFYRQHRIPVTFAGHPLADQIPVEEDAGGAREELGIGPGPMLAVMPGSRRGEIARMCDLFLQVSTKLAQQHRDLQFVIPAANADRYREIRDILQNYPAINVKLVEGNSHRVMAAADAVLLTSGTTALEAMLLKKPMVVAYRMGAFSYKLASKLVKTPYISLPNLIAGKAVIPELIQHEASVDNLVVATADMLFNKVRRDAVRDVFYRLHGELRRNASHVVACELAQMIRERHAD